MYSIDNYRERGIDVQTICLGGGVARRGDVGEAGVGKGVAVRPTAAWWASRHWQCPLSIGLGLGVESSDWGEPRSLTHRPHLLFICTVRQGPTNLC
jgi:hypothetical protein